MCIMVIVTERVQLRKTPLFLIAFLRLIPDLLTNRVSVQDYPIEERQWLLGTTYNTGIECLQFVHHFSVLTPPILDPSLHGRLYAGRSSDHRCIWFLVTRIGTLAVTVLVV